ncbi:PT domain-containing protein [Streptomyces lydicus]|uniref:PT domain-containing protein n=1 Tax=Streptomyces lydicus TaxID=47763 RepID=UPI003674376B
MGCGRERQPAGPAVADGAPPPPAQPPAPPVQTPVPAAPGPGGPTYAAGAPASPVGALLSRTAKGDWVAALKVAAGPTALLLVLASVAAMFLADKAHSGGLGWGVRMRIALAMLLQGVGGGVSLSGNASASLEAFGAGLAGEVTLSLVPLLVTAAWAGVLAFAARRFVAVRPGLAGTAVLEAVLRVAVLCGAGAFALGLLAQPSYDGVELSSAPFRTLLWSFLLSAVVCGAAVGRGGAGAWLAARPGWRAAVGALRTALLALLVVVTLAGAVTVVAVLATEKQDLDDGAIVAMLVLLPNIGALALAAAWGAPVTAEWNLPGVPFIGTSSGRESLGYGELGHLGGGWVLFGVIVGGVVGALLVGFLAVRRSAERREQLLAAGFFVVSLMLLVLAAGVSATAVFRDGGGSDGGYGSGAGDAYGSGFGGGYGGAYGGHVAGAHGELGASGAETLLFALVWTFGAVLVMPYLLRMVGRGGGPAAPAVPPAPYAAPAVPPAVAYDTPAAAYDTPAAAYDTAAAAYDTPVAPPVPATPTAPDLPALVPDVTPPAPAPVLPLAPSEEPVRPPRRVLKWVAIGLAAFLVGGGATAGALYVKDHGGSSHRADRADKPSGATTGAPGPGPSVAASPTATASGNPTLDPSGSPTGAPSGGPTGGPEAALPPGFVQKYDPNGFSLAVRRDWERSPKGTQTDYKAPAGEQYLRIGVIANTPQSSYDNFLSMEKGARKRVDYQRVEMRKNTFQDRPAARWEFTYVNDAGDTVHAVDQAYVAADGTEYSIYYECPEAQYDPDNDQVFSTALATWSVSATDVD